MNKEILQEYIDACELIKDTEKDINRLRQKRKTIIQTSVRGSSHDFPYTEQRFRVEGTAFSALDDSRLRHEERILEQRKANAEKIKLQVEEWMLAIPIRMQRIIRYRYIEEMSWDQVATKMGRKATADSVRMELDRFIDEK